MNNLTKDATKDTKIFYPNNEAYDKEKITIDKEQFIIHIPTKTAHTDTDIMIEHINSKTLFTGDNDFVGRMGRFDNSSNMHNNIKTLEYAKKLNIKTYVPGHGKSGDFKYAVAPFLNYLKIIKTETQQAYKQELEAYEIKDKVIKNYIIINYGVVSMIKLAST